MQSDTTYLLLVGEGNNPINGDVKVDSYKDQIALMGWEWSMKGSSASQDDQDTYQVEGEYLELKKRVDAASSTLMNYLDQGKTCLKATITMLQSTEDGIAMRLLLNDVRLMSLNTTVDDGEQSVSIVETWEVSYKSLAIDYIGEQSKKQVSLKKDSALFVKSVGFEMTQRPKYKIENSKKNDLPLTQSVLIESTGQDDDWFGYE